ncbi:MAG: SAM-dependent methyltransferase [Ktedonobacteraceae bacterium]|nr:SAM-dependent methyltransferase [Ktedonobacteraceae bacterium]
MQSDTRNADSLAATSHWVAAVRAQESKQADPLFNDPWAAALAGREGLEWLERRTVDNHADFRGVLIRTRFFDDFLLAKTAQYHIRQVVLVASGLDTRAFRLAWPEGTSLFELDRPQVLQFKDRVLSSAGAKPSCRHQAIGVDLEDSWADALALAGFDAKECSVWVLEGLFSYLAESSVLRLLDIVTAMTVSGSWLGFETLSRDTVTSEAARFWEEIAAVQLRFGTNEPEALLTPRGWTPTVLQFGEEGANFGRWVYPVLPRSSMSSDRSFLVTAARQ